MSAHLSPTRPATLATQPLVAMLRDAWRDFRRAYTIALRAEASRHHLRRLDDRMLADIGITRAQARSEADRKPWPLV